MSYEKRLCILKQVKRGFSADGGVLAGAVYAERIGTQLILTPRVTDFAPVREGRYAIVVWAEKKMYCLELKRNGVLRIPGISSLRDGFAVLLCFVRSAQEVDPVAFGGCGNAPKNYGELLRFFAGEEKERPFLPPMPLSPFEQPVPANPQSPRAPSVPLPGEAPPEDDAPKPESEPDGTVPPPYDDEAIAQTDYFGEALTRERTEVEEIAPDQPAESLFRLSRGGLTYYNKVKDDFLRIMRKYPKDERLSAIFPHSEWVKTERTLFGVIYAEGVPRYLCVAEEAHGKPSDAFLAAGAYVPKSIFDEEDGFYVVFQDAGTGEYVAVSDV